MSGNLPPSPSLDGDSLGSDPETVGENDTSALNNLSYPNSQIRNTQGGSGGGGGEECNSGIRFEDKYSYLGNSPPDPTQSADSGSGRSAGVTYTSMSGFGDVVVRDPPATATGLWSALVDAWRGGLAGEISAAVRDVLAGATRAEAIDRLEDLVGDALDGALVDVLLPIAGDTDTAAFWRAIATLPQLGSGRPLGFRTDLDDCHAALTPLHAAGRTPTVAIHLPDEFRDADPRTRSEWCRLVAALGRACDVRLVCSGVDRAWLAEYHRDNLPGVRDRWSSPRDGAAPRAAALDVVATGSRHARTLRLLADEDTETLAYHRLNAEFDVGRSRIRQVVGDLADVDLVNTYGSSQNRRVELSAFGRQFFTEEIAVQQRLEDCVSEPGKLSKNSRVTPRVHEAAPTAEANAVGGGERHRLPSFHETRYAGRRTAAAALGTAVEPGVSVVDYPVDLQDDRAEGRWHAEDDRLVVTAEGDNPMQMWTTLALSLADRRTFDRVLTRRRLDDHDVLDMLDDGKTVLRGMRNIGWLPDDVTEYEDLRDALLDAAVDLAELTSDLREADDDALRSDVTRLALGLAGAVTQLLDLADVDLVRVLKLPEFSRRFNTSDETNRRRRADLFESIRVGSSIASTYGHHVAHRLLFEDRESKRKQAFDPTIDAADPYARLVGSWVLVGDFAGQTDAVAADLREAFEGADAVDDAPEIRIRTEVRTDPTRRQVAETARRMLATKGLKPTPEAVSVLHGLARTPFDVADALQYLAGENDDRRVDAAEVRYALAQLAPGRLLRGFDGRRTTPRRLVAALLEADRPLSGAELDERAGVSSRSRREHLADLEAAGLVERTGAGVRLLLAFSDVDGEHSERYWDVYPDYVEDPELRPTVHAAAKTLRVGREHHGPDGPVEDPGFAFDGVVDSPDPRDLSHPWPWLDAILPALWGVRERERYRDDPAVVPTPETASIHAGPRLRQAPIGGDPAPATSAD